MKPRAIFLRGTVKAPVFRRARLTESDSRCAATQLYLQAATPSRLPKDAL
jgi:hypothetical protein